MSSSIDLKNVQGDILSGLPKKAEAFYFFHIDHVEKFRSQLLKLVPLITSTEEVSEERTRIANHKQHHSEPLPICFINIAFSAKGLQKIGVNAGDLKDEIFAKGMLEDADLLGDPGKRTSGTFDPDWIPAFKKGIDGVIMVAGYSHNGVEGHLAEALSLLRGSITEVVNIFGHVRPGEEDGHEHFGFQDGISNPAINGIDKDAPPQNLIDPGVILCGRTGDSVSERPAWALDGSILAFRLLNQLVPEFNRFLTTHALHLPDPTAPGAELLGARLVGRWKSGAPIDITPLRDDPTLAADKTRNNAFQYDPASQERCPFAAHTRKMNPRSDLGKAAVDPHRIVRRGIQFGPEVTPAEKAAHVTEKERGLLFVSYQSSLAEGFHFLQETWANNPAFPPKKPQQPGFDPIIGQNGDGPDNDGDRSMSGANPDNVTGQLDLGMRLWVVPRGGEYFFSPSIKVLREDFAKEAKDEL